MKFVASDKSCLTWSGDCLVVGLSEESLPLTGLLSDLNEQVSGLLQELIDETDFKAKVGSSAVIRVGGSVRKLAIVGLGAAEDLKLEGLRRAAAVAAKLAKCEKCASLGISFPIWNNSPERTTQTIAEGVTLAMHEDKRFKSDPETPKVVLSDVALLDLPGHEDALETASHVCDGVILARELVAAPPNIVTPASLAETAAAIANDHGLTLKVLEQAECEELGMGAYLGVAMASEMPPKFIHLTYTPAGTPKRKLALIGKGLTFDSGGLNIKAGAGSMIELMKMDMGGAAAVLGAAKAIAQIKPDVEVHFISAATENMISGHAMHPGDILTASNGKTIEVNNTDAEGRLTLADALVYADKLGLDAMVDLATLTGACIVALGNDLAGLFSPNDELAGALANAAEAAGEKLWRMPMEEKYFDGLKSIVADMKNTGPRPGGSITAALFLKQFVKETDWAHMDIAGPVWSEKDNAYNNPGATGYGVRTLVQWILESA
ncbi:leucyl aminopeptidase [Leptothoe spongobia]|uniref:Probable cytosol aminopeptidase n=1 Tax=Leptothoe spongobia TAU-MAC 1115 TaxID=1967444 RepID=A0A947GQM2_9CYAN|nr:leucyl aminopeptidase [Leptothoe spongobia]MBT9317111.1 leucyl aminopeptidase [Leptothoe spongobia TAU-MAC 1115]